MNESITIQIPIQLEYFSDQFVRGRPLGPWRLQAVGKTSAEVLKQLSKVLTKRLVDTLPSDLFAGGLSRECESWKSSVELPPQNHDASWEMPLQIELDCFRWLLDNGHCLVRVPAVNCTLFGKPAELDEAEVAKQARVALLRMAENQGLLSLSQRFNGRVFEMQRLPLALPLGGQPEPEERKREDRKKTSALRAAASDLSKAKLAEIHGLNEKAAELADHFLGDSPQSVLLVGPAGVGKTSLLYRLVQMSSELGLGDRHFWSTSGARIVSGMSGLGMWQQRCSKLIRQAHATKAILHLGSLFELLEAGKIDGQPGVASMVRQSIARGKLLAVAECTPEQLAIVEREDPMLLRAFSRMDFKEQGPDEIRNILRAAARQSGATQQVDYSEQAIEELVRLHTRFATYSALPATALQLMRTISDRAPAGSLVEADQVARAFSRQTGLPNFLVDDSISIDLAAVRDRLSEQVVGQAEPVDLIVNMIATLKARMVRPGRPLVSLMFIGPTGVGKTELAKAIASLLYSDTSRMIRIDMSEYASPWSSVKLIGKPGEGDGTLTSPIREQPFSVVLLDEFEKADPNVFDLLLQLLGEGRLTDSQGRLADFRNAVVIMTSNLGADSFRGGGVGFGEVELANWREHFEREVRRFVRPEFLGRLDRIVAFRPLSRDVVKQIAHRELDKLRQRPGLKYRDMSLSFEDSAIELLCELGYQPKYGARPLRRAIERNVAVPLANALSNQQGDDTWSYNVVGERGEIVVQAKKLSAKTRSDRRLEIEVVDSWQQLGRMARTARISGPVRDLENELERTHRQNEALEKRLEKVQGPSRISAMRLQIQQGQAFIEISRKILDFLRETTERITQEQLSLMTAWQQGIRVDWQHWQALEKSELTLLRQSTEDVLRRRVSGCDAMSIVVSGRGENQLEALLKSYRMLAVRNQWKCQAYQLHEYDPGRDESSLEFRKQQASRQGSEPIKRPNKPDLRLKAGIDGELALREPLADAFLVGEEAGFQSTWPNLCGFALQFQGLGLESWLETEGGIIHFYDPTVTGPKRRLRFRTMVFPQRLTSLTLPVDWLEPVASDLPNPRRMIDVSEQLVRSSFNIETYYSQGKLPDGLLLNMREEHERALWDAIGYQAIPSSAKLGWAGEMDIPY